jgi:hypothetical protein
MISFVFRVIVIWSVYSAYLTVCCLRCAFRRATAFHFEKRRGMNLALPQTIEEVLASPDWKGKVSVLFMKVF